MEGYDEARVIRIAASVEIPFSEEITGKDVAKIEVKKGSRIFNLVKFALSALERNVNLLISAQGAAITKAVTIVEIIKRRRPNVFQWSKVSFQAFKEFWNPSVEGMTRLKVTRELPSMYIFLTLSPLDGSLPGVQVPAEIKPHKRRKDIQPAEVGAEDAPEQKRSRLRNPSATTASGDSSSSKEN